MVHLDDEDTKLNISLKVALRAYFLLLKTKNFIAMKVLNSMQPQLNPFLVKPLLHTLSFHSLCASLIVQASSYL